MSRAFRSWAHANEYLLGAEYEAVRIVTDALRLAKARLTLYTSRGNVVHELAWWPVNAPREHLKSDLQLLGFSAGISSPEGPYDVVQAPHTWAVGEPPFYENVAISAVSMSRVAAA